MGFSIPIGNSLDAGFGSPIGRAVSNGLFVGLEVEVDEESQVAGQEATTEKSCGLTASAVAHMRNNTVPVGGGEMTISSKVDDEKVNHELDDLHAGQVFLPPDFSATSSSIIVIIHYDMDK